MLKQYGKFSEEAARSYFKQLLIGLKHCHEKGIMHRDLKPENILLDSQYTLKLADFGYAGFAEQSDKGYFTKYLGTKSYMAPEIHLFMPYRGETADIFSAGVILFILVAGYCPFGSATRDNLQYK